MRNTIEVPKMMIVSKDGKHAVNIRDIFHINIVDGLIKPIGIPTAHRIYEIYVYLRPSTSEHHVVYSSRDKEEVKKYFDSLVAQINALELPTVYPIHPISESPSASIIKEAMDGMKNLAGVENPEPSSGWYGLGKGLTPLPNRLENSSCQNP